MRGKSLLPHQPLRPPHQTLNSLVVAISPKAGARARARARAYWGTAILDRECNVGWKELL